MTHSWRSKLDRKIAAILLGVSCILLTMGLLTTPSLGDEISHYRQAKAIFYAQARVVTDPVYQKTQTAYFYNSEPFWHLGLAIFWGLAGKESYAVAQIYHVFYVLLLLLSTYLLAREFEGEKTGFLSVLLLAPMPFIVAFGILFYTDVPVAALCLLGMLLLQTRKIFWASFVMMAAVLTKVSALFFIPGFMVYLLFNYQEALKKRLVQVLGFTAPIVLAAFWDFEWRKNQINKALLFLGNHDVTSDLNLQTTLLNRLLLKDWPKKLAEYSNTSLLNLFDIFKCFGIAAVILCVFYLFLKKDKRISPLFSFSLMSYFFFFCYIFHFGADIRYLLPIAPLLAILAARAAVRFWDLPWFKIPLIFLLGAQFIGALGYVYKERAITPEIKQAFNFIQRTVFENELVIYPEYVLVEQTERGMIWSYRFRDQLTKLFWDEDKKEIIRFLIKGNIHYLAVKKSRVYDDAFRHHFAGYPKSFVGHLGSSPYFKLIFENQAMSVWKILPS